MTEVTEDLTKRRHLVPVACFTVEGQPDGLHLSVHEWLPKFGEWATGLALCGRSAEQGALPTGTVVTCQDCEGLRDSYERALAGRPTAEQQEIAELRAQLAELNDAITWETACLNCASLLTRSYEDYCRAEQAEATLRIARFTAEHWRDEMMKSDGTRLAAHPGAMILTALGGEADPVECGIDDWARDAFRAVAASKPTREQP